MQCVSSSQRNHCKQQLTGNFTTIHPPAKTARLSILGSMSVLLRHQKHEMLGRKGGSCISCSPQLICYLLLGKFFCGKSLALFSCICSVFFSCYSPLVFLLLDDTSRMLIFELFVPQFGRQIEELSIHTCQYLWCGACANNSLAHKHSRGMSKKKKAQACSKRDINERPLKEASNSVLPGLWNGGSFAGVRAEGSDSVKRGGRRY